jgi:CDP-paratose 2-epimerase
MSLAVVTGSAGLIGSETVESLCALGYDVIGIDNDMRRVFFGEDGSTTWNRESLQNRFPKAYRHFDVDIRDESAINDIFRRNGDAIELVVHAAAQPSHDWAARDPQTDFTVNANGTLSLLEATRRAARQATFIFTSTNKVYGDTPNRLPLVEGETRWEIDPSHPFVAGIDEQMSIDASTHSLFGASKVAADILVQEYGRYFGIRTGVFRCGCLTGPKHSGTELHGFLAYLMKCVCTGAPYTVFGHKGKQVRDNMHSADLVTALLHFHQEPRPGEVYNLGGSRFSHCSMLEGIRLCEDISGRVLDRKYSDISRVGDHRWYVSDVSKFKAHYPEWRFQYDLRAMLEDIYEKNVGRWTSEVPNMKNGPRRSKP